ncbi:MAG: hypothetical protein QW100_04045 [Thermoplasmatales archaeon]
MRAEFVGEDRIFLVGIVKGLKESGRVVSEVYSENKFDLLLLPITEGEVEGIRHHIREPVDVEMDDIEIIYEYYMKKFGETSIPPEAYVTAVRLADRDGVEISGIDIPTGSYEDVFVNNVQLNDLISLSFRKRRLMKRKWNMEDPISFSLDWDRYINRGGYKNVEKERVKFISQEIINKKRKNTLVILEVERFQEVVSALKNSLQGYKFQESEG